MKSQQLSMNFGSNKFSNLKQEGRIPLSAYFGRWFLLICFVLLRNWTLSKLSRNSLVIITSVSFMTVFCAWTTLSTIVANLWPLWRSDPPSIHIRTNPDREIPNVLLEWLGRWHNGSTFVFCSGDCPTFADACGEVTSCSVSHQEAGTCSTRGGSQGMYITFASRKSE